MFTSPSDCPDCGVRPGQLHHDGCDVARCATTGQQRAGCGHSGSTCITRWTGHWPGDAECWEYGFFIQPDPGAPPNTPPLPDINRLYLECDWDPAQQRMIRRASSSPPESSHQ
ncbi:hypothetical protein [Streptomyces aureoversilis]|uniref:Uncharacterized protein n=1 Tax=Streptomyces aureoversilis TaxID=67277 RepID=A0ABW0A9G7_9ACTN